MGETMIKIFSDIDYDDLTLYGINVEVDFETGNTYITRDNKIIVSVERNPKTKKIEVKKRLNGELRFLNNLIKTIENYQEQIKKGEYKIEELDRFFYAFVCNNGTKTREIELYSYDAETRKLFWQFFNQYVKLRFNGDYKKDINIPELIEIEYTIIDLDIDAEENEDAKKELEHAQFFCYTRQKNRKIK